MKKKVSEIRISSQRGINLEDSVMKRTNVKSHDTNWTLFHGYDDSTILIYGLEIIMGLEYTLDCYLWRQDKDNSNNILFILHRYFCPQKIFIGKPTSRLKEIKHVQYHFYEKKLLSKKRYEVSERRSPSQLGINLEDSVMKRTYVKSEYTNMCCMSATSKRLHGSDDNAIPRNILIIAMGYLLWTQHKKPYRLKENKKVQYHFHVNKRLSEQPVNMKKEVSERRSSSQRGITLGDSVMKGTDVKSDDTNMWFMSLRSKPLNRASMRIRGPKSCQVFMMMNEVPSNNSSLLETATIGVIRSDNVGNNAVELRKEMNRYASFVNFPLTSCWPSRLAAAGFYYRGTEDEVFCFNCNINYKNWKPTDNPLQIHKQLSPSCRFVLFQEGNEPIQVTDEARVRLYAISGVSPNLLCNTVTDSIGSAVQHSASTTVSSISEDDLFGWTHSRTNTLPAGRQTSQLVSSSAQTSQLVSSAGQTSQLVSSSAQTSQLVSSAGQTSQLVFNAGQTSQPVFNTGQTSQLVSSTGQTSQLVSSSAQTSQLVSSAGQTSQLVFNAGQTSQPVFNPGQTSQLVSSAGQTSQLVFNAGQTSQPVFNAGQTSQLVFNAGQIPQSVFNAGQTSQPVSSAGQTLQFFPSAAAQTISDATTCPDFQLLQVFQLPRHNSTRLSPNVKFTEYADFSRRVSSFTCHWPHPARQTPEQLAQAGFFFSGKSRDSTMCFFCGGGLKNWVAGDNPYVEHARWFPSCEFIREVKGDNFVDMVQEMNENGEEINYDQVMEIITDNRPIVERLGIKQHQADSTCDDQESDDLPIVIVSKATRNASTVTSIAAGTDTRTAADTDTSTDTRTAADTDTSTVTRTATGAVAAAASTDVHTMHQENEQLHQQIVCKVCLENSVSIVFLPCGHLCCCTECAARLRKCPLCRKRIQGTVRAFLG